MSKINIDNEESVVEDKQQADINVGVKSNQNEVIVVIHLSDEDEEALLQNKEEKLNLNGNKSIDEQILQNEVEDSSASIIDKDVDQILEQHIGAIEERDLHQAKRLADLDSAYCYGSNIIAFHAMKTGTVDADNHFFGVSFKLWSTVILMGDMDEKGGVFACATLLACNKNNTDSDLKQAVLHFASLTTCAITSITAYNYFTDNYKPPVRRILRTHQSHRLALSSIKNYLETFSLNDFMKQDNNITPYQLITIDLSVPESISQHPVGVEPICFSSPIPEALYNKASINKESVNKVKKANTSSNELSALFLNDDPTPSKRVRAPPKRYQDEKQNAEQVLRGNKQSKTASSAISKKVDN